MGISDLGVRNVSGVLTPYDYNTSSVWGSITLTRAQSIYVDGDGPDTFGVQLNAVATNITLFGTPGYQFWTQDFFTYTASSHTLSFGDNVWNFSAPPGLISSNVFASVGPNGTLVAPVYYYALGPTLTVPYPFTVNLYLNGTVVHSLPRVYFNYTVVNGGGRVAGGTFDNVTFNATTGSVVSVPPAPAFQVNGTGVDPLGLPNDLELVIVGDGLGDTTTFAAINATMALRTWSAPAHGYANVPAAYDAGSDTGETSNGVLPIYRASSVVGPPSVTLETGPSFVQGLWNVSTALDGARLFHVVQRQQNAFLFVSPGSTLNEAQAQWVPTFRFGSLTSDFWIPNTGVYSFEWMLSGRTPYSCSSLCISATPNSTTTILNLNLTVNYAAGSYTPLYAWGNSTLAAISQSGNGTLGNPYVLVHHAVGPLNPVFGQMNDYGFPVFAGVLLVNTSRYVDVAQPGLTVDYGPWMDPLLTYLGVPSTNSLQMEFWNDTNVTVTSCYAISGWVPVDFSLFPTGEVLFWGSSDNLVEGNTFHDQGIAIALYGGTNNTIWGNTILPGSTNASLDFGNNTTGIVEWESGDLIYNNYFDVVQPAVTPTFDPFSCQIVCQPARYQDLWNVSLQPASDNRTVLGWVLSGSILSTAEQGGNFWSNYGSPADPFGRLPYNDSGLITQGGDYYPLVPSTLYPVTFVEAGLLPGVTWNVTLLGLSANASAPSILLYAPNGSYNASVLVPAGYLGPRTVPVVVNGTGVTVAVNFSELFNVTIDEVGLVSGWTWTAWLNGTSVGSIQGAFNTTSGSATLALTNGSYRSTFRAYGYAVSAGPGRVTVGGHATTRTVTFALVAVFSVTASGLPSGTPWTVTVTQGPSVVQLTAVGDGTIVFTVLQINPGAFTWVANASGYSATPASGGGSAPAPSGVDVAFAATGPPAFDWMWVLVAALAGAAALGFLLFLRERRRGRRPPPPKPMAPAAVPVAPVAAAKPKPWDESAPEKTPPPASPPWEEAPSDTERPEPYARKP